MDIQQLRHSLKDKWLVYYQQNRSWLFPLKTWATYDGQRRPASSLILATLSILEPELTQMLPFIVTLESNPDKIVAALGLNFDPEQYLQSQETIPLVTTPVNGNGVEATSLPEISANGNDVEATSLPEISANGNGVEATSLPRTSANGNGTLKPTPVAAIATNGNGSPKPTAPSPEGEVSASLITQVSDLASRQEVTASPVTQASNLPSWQDELCYGKGNTKAGIVLSILAVVGALAVVVAGLTA